MDKENQEEFIAQLDKIQAKLSPEAKLAVRVTQLSDIIDSFNTAQRSGASLMFHPYSTKTEFVFRLLWKEYRRALEALNIEQNNL